MPKVVKTHHPLYFLWCGLRYRCFTPTNKAYPNYGGRGILVDDRWLGPNGFCNFVADMGERPEGFSVERLDNDGPYSPENCVWASRSTQNRNTRLTRTVTAWSETKLFCEWIEDPRCLVKMNCLYNRLYRTGMPAEEAMTIPAGRPKTRLTEHDVRVVFALSSLGHSQTGIGEMFGVAQNTVSQILSGKSWANLGCAKEAA